jgi:hypothetical protein
MRGAVEPPKPRLFRAIAFFGILIGAVGLLSSVNKLSALSRVERRELPPLMGPPTEQHAAVMRKVQRRIEQVIDRHRPVTVGLELANAALSLLLLAGGLTLGTGRTWAHWIMLQGLAASALYELPATLHELRLDYETTQAMRRFFPDLLRAQSLPTGMPEDAALATTGVLAITITVTLAMTVLRVAYYGTGFWYLRRRDVKAWFEERRDM